MPLKQFTINRGEILTVLEEKTLSLQLCHSYVLGFIFICQFICTTHYYFFKIYNQDQCTIYVFSEAYNYFYKYLKLSLVNKVDPGYIKYSKIKTVR